jgi:hypothetical protein
MGRRRSKSDSSMLVKEFNFEELADDVQLDAIEKIRQSDNYLWDNWYEFVIQSYKEDLNANGYNDVEISFSGFWSQGDGASFTAKSVDIGHFLEKWKNDYGFLKWVVDSNFSYFECIVERISHHYSHENTCKIDWEESGFVWEEADLYLSDFKIKTLEALGGEKYILEKFDQLGESIEKDRKDWCRKIYKALEDEYEYLMTNEAIIEYIEGNALTFDEFGDLI